MFSFTNAKTLLIPLLCSMAVNGLNIPQAREEVKTSGPLWSEISGQPVPADVKGKDSTWLLATANAIAMADHEALENQYRNHAEPTDDLITAAIAVHNKDLVQQVHTTNWAPDLATRFSINSETGQNWWPAVLEDAVIWQNDAGWIRDGNFLNDQETQADAATGLWIILGKETKTEKEPSKEVAAEWFKKAKSSPIVIRLKSTKMFYNTRVFDNDLNDITLYSPITDANKEHVKLDDILADIAEIGHLVE